MTLIDDLIATLKQAKRRIDNLNESGPRDIGEDPTITKIKRVLARAKREKKEKK